MIPGLVTNYKYFEDFNKSEHFYEITCLKGGEEVCYYAHGERGIPLAFGTDIKLDTSSNKIKIGGFELQIEGPFQKHLNIVNYKGFVLDCLDSDIGVYNLDNEIYLFGSACLDLPIGSNVTFFNLHLVYMRDLNWMFNLFSKSIKKSTHVLVYCPVFSSYLEGSETVSFDNLIRTKSNFTSLIYTNKWLKYNFSIEFPGFSQLDEISALLFNSDTSDKGAVFLGHCEKCLFSSNFVDFNDSGRMKKISSAKEIKESFHKIKKSLQDTSTYNNQVLSETVTIRGEIIHGVIKRNKGNIFDLTSNDITIPIYCEDSSFNPVDDSSLFIFNAHQIIELIPKLRVPNSWITKAYLWISPETRVWSPNGFFRNNPLSFTHPSEFVSCKIVKKYLILKDFNNCQYETTIIHVESEKGPRCFHLSPTEKYYAVINNETAETIISIRHLIHESFFKKTTDTADYLPSTAIIPTLSCTLNEQTIRSSLQVCVNDIPYLNLIRGLQFFSIKLRIYSISSLSMKLICSKCKSQVESGNCLGHFRDFIAKIVISAVIEALDMNDTPCSILIDQFALFDKIYGLDKMKIINSLKGAGSVKLSPDHFSFKEYFKTVEKPSLESTIANLIPRLSKLINCNFSMTTTSVLKPINLEICDPKTEIINILKLL